MKGSHNSHNVSEMFRRLRRPLFYAVLYGIDFSSPIIAFLLAYWLRYEKTPFVEPLREVAALPTVQIALALTAATYVFLLGLADFYRLHKVWFPLDIAFRLLPLTGAIAMLLAVLVRTHDALSSRFFLLYFWLILLFCAMAGRLAARAAVLLLLCIGIGLKRVVLVGGTKETRQLLQTLHQHPHFGCRVIGIVSLTGEDAVSSGMSKNRIFGSRKKVMQGLLDLKPHLVMISTLFKKDEAVFELIAQCMEAGIDVRVVPEFSELYGSRLIVDRVGLIPLLHLQPLKTPYARAASKRFFDLTLSLLFLPLLLTVTACLWLFKGVSSREPVLVKDLRCGKGSKGFYLYYFNPKLLRSGSGSTGQLAMLLRALPQLVNVLKGDMAIVGPRAAKAEFVAHLSSWEKRVLAIRPGLIGYGGINDPCIEDFNSERLPWELSYIEHQSLALDLSHIAGVWTSIVAGLLHIKGNWGAV